MRIFFDTEFYEDGKTIDLISIGMVREDGETYYAESAEHSSYGETAWIRENVRPLLNGLMYALPKESIRSDIIKFCGPNPEFWADYAAYDWVVLCQLFGTMMDLPKTWPYFCRDIQQLRNGRDLPHQTTKEHHALNDALHCKMLYEHLTQEQAIQPRDVSQALKDYVAMGGVLPPEMLGSGLVGVAMQSAPTLTATSVEETFKAQAYTSKLKELSNSAVDTEEQNGIT